MKYRGYYIDHIVFNSKEDIDSFIKKQAIDHYKMLCAMFANKPSMELSFMMSDRARELHDIHGMSYEEIETLELDAFAA